MAVKSQEELDELVRRMKAEKAGHENYRERSLKLHGHNNNPSDGSNWENLCTYCHDDEHSRSILADYLHGSDRK